MEHHQAPYYHISIDDPIIAFGVMVLSTVVFGCALGVALGSVANLGCVGLCFPCPWFLQSLDKNLIQSGMLTEFTVYTRRSNMHSAMAHGP